MKRVLLALAALLCLQSPAHAQSSPGIYNGQIPSAAQWNAWFSGKQDVSPGLLSGPGFATPGHVVSWGNIYPGTVDGGALPSVLAGTCLAVAGGPAYTVSISPPCILPRGYIDGLAISTASAARTFSVAVGTATDANNALPMILGSSITKTNTGAWVVGTGNGCMDTGSAAVSTWYHIYLIEKTDRSAVDAICSLSASAPTMPTGWTFSRRIGSMLTTSGTANWTAFTQIGEEFRWSTPINDINSAALGTTATNFSISVPPGISVKAWLRGYAASGSVGTKVVVVSPLAATPVAGTPAGEVTAVSQVAANPVALTVEVLTDTTQHVTAVASAASTTLVVDTFGWVDRRGRNN